MVSDPERFLNHPLLNKGTAFTKQERSELGLHGYLPYHISTIEEQVHRRYLNFKNQPSDLLKYLFLSSLQNRNEVLFYRLVHEHISEMLPLIYTPTVGDASLNFSDLYAYHRGLYLSFPLQSEIPKIIADYPRDDIDVIVATDGERILGLGDVGIGGMAIPVGKLALYTLFGGIHPSRTLPVFLDVGTNNQKLRDDPFYLGWHSPRVTGAEYSAFMDAFVQAIRQRYPRALLQWEDFGKVNAYALLQRYQNDICSFNDDIQGTAAVVLAAVHAASRKMERALCDHKIVIFGAGSAGLGIAQILFEAIEKQSSTRQAKEALYLIDVHGLIHTGQTGLTQQHQFFARSPEEFVHWKIANRDHISLLDTVQGSKASVLIGVSAQPMSFSKEVVTALCANVKNPAIFPLSNPTAKCEATPIDLLNWSQGKAIIATGSPFPAVTYNGKRYEISQCNNVNIFPGLGLGAVAVKSSKITSKMLHVAAEILSQYSPLLQGTSEALFPPFEKLREISKHIAMGVATVACREHLASIQEDEIAARVAAQMWFPSYAELLR